MTDQVIHFLPLTSLVASSTNPRKHFDPARLAELAESIKASGVHQPVLVRPLPAARVPETGRGVTHEIVAGERRYRASQMAGEHTIPAWVRDLTDEQVLEIQLVENLLRDDLTPLEEANGYDRLLRQSGMDRTALAARIGKSVSYVHGRLKLLDLGTDGRICNSDTMGLALKAYRMLKAVYGSRYAEELALVRQRYRQREAQLLNQRRKAMSR